jgi:hypothetical protein
VTAAALASLCLVLLPAAPTALQGLVWLPVLAIACAKPTLGDTLEGWWFAASGGTLGCAVGLPLLWLGQLGRLAALGAMAIAFFAIVLLLGDHIQASARSLAWALATAAQPPPPNRHPIAPPRPEHPKARVLSMVLRPLPRGRVQARWALLPPLVALLQLANGASYEVALAEMGKPLLGMGLGGGVATVARLV